jgi:hypothetical protein
MLARTLTTHIPCHSYGNFQAVAPWSAPETNGRGAEPGLGLLTVALRLKGVTGSPVNPIALFRGSRLRVGRDEPRGPGEVVPGARTGPAASSCRRTTALLSSCPQPRSSLRTICSTSPATGTGTSTTRARLGGGLRSLRAARG